MTFDEWAARHPQAAAELITVFTPEVPSDKGGSEQRVESLVTLESVKYGSLWRNNAGQAELAGQPVRFGLGNVSAKFWKNWRSSDRVGITRINYGDRTFGVFTACEIKKPGWKKPTDDREHAQANFLANVAQLGGIAGFVTCVEDYHRLIAEYVR